MTDAEKAVLARYPDAECWSFLFSRYIVFRSRHEGKLAEGGTPEAAWAAAASSFRRSTAA